MTWRVSCQDYRRWRTTDFKEPHPDVYHFDYPTIEEAEAERDRMRSEGLTACVSPTPAPKRGRMKRVAMMGDDKFNKDWKLHV